MVVGKNVYIAHYSYVNAAGGLVLNDGVVIGPMCVLATSNHRRENGRVGNVAESHEINIGSGTWLGAHVTVTAGVRIGSGVVVGAGSVVTKDLPDNVLAVGAPARVVRHLSTK